MCVTVLKWFFISPNEYCMYSKNWNGYQLSMINMRTSNSSWVKHLNFYLQQLPLISISKIVQYNIAFLDSWMVYTLDELRNVHALVESRNVYALHTGPAVTKKYVKLCRAVSLVSKDSGRSLEQNFKILEPAFFRFGCYGP